MQLNRKMTGALALGGVALVLLIPSADFVSGQLGGQSMLVTNGGPKATSTAGTAATVEATKPMTVAAIDPVKDYLSKGKTLPDYISGGGTAPNVAAVKPDTKAAPAAVAAPTAAVTAPAPASTASEPEVANVEDSLVAPVPMPAEMRPRPRPATAAPKVVAATPSPAAEQPLIIDEEAVDLLPLDRAAGVDDDLIQPPESIRTVPAEDVLLPPANVGRGAALRNNQLDEDEEELAAYLEREGLVGRPSTRLQRLRQLRDNDEEYGDGPRADEVKPDAHGTDKADRGDDGSSIIFLTVR